MFKLPLLAHLTLGFTLFFPNIAQAALVNYNFQGTIDTGSLVGETYSGSVTFNDASLTGIGDEFIPISDLTFNFFSTTFTQFDADAPIETIFSDGEFLGIEYAVTVTDAFFPVANFALTTGFDIDEAAFIYTPRIGNSGQGGVIYNQVIVAPAVPESSSILGLMVLGTVGILSRVRRN